MRKKILLLFVCFVSFMSMAACSSDNSVINDNPNLPENPITPPNPSDDNTGGITNPTVSGIAPMSGKVNLWYTPKIPMQ